MLYYIETALKFIYFTKSENEIDKLFLSKNKQKITLTLQLF